ncbi:MAG: hypothetical protein A3K12_07555 [Candidatus Rokubacteria bacterium RIFCSPLOWO2_12_FULL_71_19]|nr:MAG: hypothetical protein A3K12_07555 [Candidatus Rokubacteria bacterium RIFCSPLOWO2_12_FULL_71_19]
MTDPRIAVPTHHDHDAAAPCGCTCTPDAACGTLVGRALVMGPVYDKIRRLAAKDVTVVVTGESGTGKDLVARSLHTCSRRSAKPFVAINCAALPDTLLESELFGHERGAFTGAYRSATGKLALADGGTLFLDEIGSMSPACQAKILRVIESHRFEPLGGHRSIDIDFRLVAATHEDLAAKAEHGAFRADLFHRLWVTHIHLPPLRERREDIPLLVEFFLQQLEDKYCVRLSASAGLLVAMAAYPWPGNVRELHNVVEGMVALTDDGVLDEGALPDELRQAIDAAGGVASPLALPERLRRYEQALLLEALQRAGGNKTHAARALGISRENFLKKLHKHEAPDPAP